MRNENPKPHPRNVDGPFYVADGCCLTCGVPKLMAPDMFNYLENLRHCFVYRQPESAEDFGRMIKVLRTQDLICIRCRSRDELLLRRLEEHGLGGICDFKA
jgi:hypothetical protein